MKFKGFNLSISWDRGRCRLDLYDLLFADDHSNTARSVADFAALAIYSSSARATPVAVTILTLDGTHRFGRIAKRGIRWAHWGRTIERWDAGERVRLGEGVQDVEVAFAEVLTEREWETLLVLRDVAESRADSEKHTPCLRVELTAVDE